MTMRYALLALSLAVLPAAALAQPIQPQEAIQPQEGSGTQGPTRDDVKINQLIVYGDEPCPQTSGEEITVCARRPEGDRWRIPEPLRGGPDTVGNTAWTTRAQQLEYQGKTGIGSCTPVGPGGGIGCFNQLLRQAMAERRDGDGTNWNQLIEEARQARLGKIDAKSEAVERVVKAEEEAKKTTP
jgi:hypothetical protein